MQAICGRCCGDRPSLSVYTRYAAGLKVSPWHCLLLAVSQQGCFVWLANVGNTCSAGSARCGAIKQVLPMLTNRTNPLQFSMHAPAQEVEVEVPASRDCGVEQPDNACYKVQCFKACTT